MNARDEAALALYQAHKTDPAIESLLEEFFNRPTADEYDRTLSLVSEEMAS